MSDHGGSSSDEWVTPSLTARLKEYEKKRDQLENELLESEGSKQSNELVKLIQNLEERMDKLKAEIKQAQSEVQQPPQAPQVPGATSPVMSVPPVQTDSQALSPVPSAATASAMYTQDKEFKIKERFQQLLSRRLQEAGYREGKLSRDQLAGSLEQIFGETLQDAGFSGQEDFFATVLLQCIPVSDPSFQAAVRDSLKQKEPFSATIAVISRFCNHPSAVAEYKSKIHTIKQGANQPDKDYFSYCLRLAMQLPVLARSKDELAFYQEGFASSIVEGLSHKTPELLAELRRFVRKPPVEIKADQLIAETINAILEARSIRAYHQGPERETCLKCGRVGHSASVCRSGQRPPNPSDKRSDTRAVNSTAIVVQSPREREPPTCTHCGKVGHVEIACWTKHPEKRPRQAQPGQGGSPAGKATPVTTLQHKFIRTAWEERIILEDIEGESAREREHQVLLARAGVTNVPLRFITDEGSEGSYIKESTAKTLLGSYIKRGNPIVQEYYNGSQSEICDRYIILDCSYKGFSAQIKVHVVPHHLDHDLLLGDADRKALGFFTAHASQQNCFAIKLNEIQAQSNQGKLTLPTDDMSKALPDPRAGGTETRAKIEEFIKITGADDKHLFYAGTFFNEDNTENFNKHLSTLKSFHEVNVAKKHPNLSLPEIVVPMNPELKQTDLAYLRNGYPVAVHDIPHVEDILRKYVANGWIEEIHRPAGAPRPKDTVLLPAFLVKTQKPDGSIKHRMVIAGNHAKGAADPNSYYRTKPPDMNNIRQLLAHGNIFAKTDIDSGYNNIRLKQDVPPGNLLFEFTIIGKIFRCLTMVQGWEHAPEVFQDIMVEMDSRIDFSDPVIQAAGTKYATFFDDKFLGLKVEINPESGKFNIDAYVLAWSKVMAVLNGDPYVILSPEKTFHLVPRVQVLGAEVGSGSLTIPGEKLLKIANLAMPTHGADLKPIRAFFNFFADYAPGINAALGVIDEHINVKGDLAKRLGIEEYKRICNTIEEVQRALHNAHPLRAYRPEDRFVIVVDSSDTAHGAAVAQIPKEITEISLEDIEKNIKTWTLFYWSKKMSTAERAYSAGHREIIGIYRVLKTNEHLLRGTRLPILLGCDNLPAIQGLQLEGGTKSNQVVRMLDYIQLFNIAFFWYRGESNLGCADLLSRIKTMEEAPQHELFPEPVLTLHGVKAIKTRAANRSLHAGGGKPEDNKEHPVETEANSESTSSDETTATPEQSTVREWVTETLGGSIIYPAQSELYSEEVEGGILLVPKPEIRDEIAKKIHIDCAHRAQEACGHAMRNYGFWWPEHRASFEKAKNECLACLRNDVKRMGYNPPVKGLSHTIPMDRVHLDIGELNVDQNGYRYFALAKDVATGFVWVEPLKTKEQHEIAVFIKQLGLFGQPRLIVTDGELDSEVLKKAARMTNAALHLTTPHRPESNGSAESGVRVFKGLINKITEERHLNWSDYAFFAAHQMNCAYQRKTGSTPFALMFHRQPRAQLEYLQGDFIHAEMTEEERTTFEKDQANLEKRLSQVIEPGILERLQEYDNKSVKRLSSKRKGANFMVGQAVFINELGDLPAGSAIRRGPYRIAGRFNEGFILYEQMAGAPFPTLMMDDRRKIPRRFPAEHLVAAPDSILEDGSEVFYVEEILDDRKNQKGEREFLVKWQGYDHSRDSWEPVLSFSDRNMIIEYDNNKRKNKNKNNNK